MFGDFFIVLVVLVSYHQVASIARPAAAASKSGNTVGEIVVEIQTPPSNLNSIINVKPADNNRPISPTPKPSPSKPPLKVPNNNRPISPSAKPPPAKQPPAKQPPKVPAGPPVINVMSIKTGLLSAANDPCSYVSCIRADSFLYCALVKCDAGQGFSQASLRCIPSKQCPSKQVKPNVQSKPSAQQAPQKLPQSPPPKPRMRT